MQLGSAAILAICSRGMPRCVCEYMATAVGVQVTLGLGEGIWQKRGSGQGGEGRGCGGHGGGMNGGI